MGQPKRSGGVLLAIAIFKLVKASLLVAIGIGALEMLRKNDVDGTLYEWLLAFRVDPRDRFVHAAIEKLAGIDHEKLEAIGVGTFVYAAVFLVEGTGLLLRKRWAEWVTVIVTASLIPFEIYEIAHEPHAGRVIALVLNVAIVVYLIWHLRRDRREGAKPSAAGRPARPARASAAAAPSSARSRARARRRTA